GKPASMMLFFRLIPTSRRRRTKHAHLRCSLHVEREAVGRPLDPQVGISRRWLCARRVPGRAGRDASALLEVWWPWGLLRGVNSSAVENGRLAFSTRTTPVTRE